MEKTYIKISNNGEIDEKAFTLIGASSKREDASKIGFFGSGLKYAIAVLLKNEIDFKVFSGLKEIKITKEIEKFRGQKFEVICINGNKTNYTIDMGPKWEPWYAIREIFCNAIDEGGNKEIEPVLEIEKKKGITNFYVEYNEKLKHLFENWNEYFSYKRDDKVADIGVGTKIYSGGKKLICYRKGVQCYEKDKKCLFHYDSSLFNINESRVTESEWDLNTEIAKVIAASNNISVINMILERIADTVEEDFNWYLCYQFSDAWLEAIDDRILIPREFGGYFSEYVGRKSILIPKRLVEALKKYFGDKVKTKGINIDDEDLVILEQTDKQKELIKDALNFLTVAGIGIEYPIYVTKLNEGQIGEARRGKIYLSERLFDFGRKEVVSTILEEYMHIQTKYVDKTREFQNHLVNTIVTLLEEKNKIYL